MKGKRKHYVYTIRDCDGNVRYVGCTQNVSSRFSCHKGSDNELGRWIRTEIEAGREVQVVIEETCGMPWTAFAKERKYIIGYSRLLGDRLFNKSQVPPKHIKYAS